MTGCDRCDCFEAQLISLDGCTLLCHKCQQDVVQQKEKLMNHPPFMSKPICSVWDYLMGHAVPFRYKQDTTHAFLVFYGGNELLDVSSRLHSWSMVAQDEIPEGVLDFGLPTEDRDIDGQPLNTSYSVFRLDTSMISIERYGCWIKVQMWV